MTGAVSTTPRYVVGHRVRVKTSRDPKNRSWFSGRVFYIARVLVGAQRVQYAARFTVNGRDNLYWFNETEIERV